MTKHERTSDAVKILERRDDPKMRATAAIRSTYLRGSGRRPRGDSTQDRYWRSHLRDWISSLA